MSSSSSRPAASAAATDSSASRRSREDRARVLAQTTLDAALDAEFDHLGAGGFDYSRWVGTAPPPRSEKTVAYLQHIQRGNLIQPFGCLLAVDERTFKVLAYSANAPEMLTMASQAVPSADDRASLTFGTDVRSLLHSSGEAALAKAFGFADVSLLNPIIVHTRSPGKKPFYAIVHRVTGALIIDFEPMSPADLAGATVAGALQSYKLAAKAIARLQSLPGGSMQRLCDTVVKEVADLTGYDRVMVYRFHDDDHGEVFAEVTKPGLEPYLGLHYPATDIPQAARFLFMKNKVRMITDCRASSVEVVRGGAAAATGISFCGSTLRAPHGCHRQYMENMNSIASLVMAAVVGAGEEKPRLWGLLVCHHESPRFVPFPLRCACEFLAQVFAVHVGKELELERQLKEKRILRTQTLLCDLLIKDSGPLSVVVGSPNVMDLVKCDGAGLLYRNAVYLIGATPTEAQTRDIAYWLAERHRDSTGLSTDSLRDAGYPGAAALGDAVCGMAAAKITPKDILFWFRSHTAAEVRWGGARHRPGEEDDGRRLHPRSSFKAFLEVVKARSSPWNDYEMDAIHSLQLILRGAVAAAAADDAVSATAALDSKVGELSIDPSVELRAVTNEMVRLIETASVPILAVDNDGNVNGWNKKIEELTGLPVERAVGEHLLRLVEDSSLPAVQKMLRSALQGQEDSNVEFEMKRFGERADEGPALLVVNACANRDIDGNVVGVCFVAQDMTAHRRAMDRFTRIEGDYRAIVESPCALIPPIFGADEFGWCSEWNAAMARLTGWRREEVLDKLLLGEVFGAGEGAGAACCRFKSQDAFIRFSIIINTAMAAGEAQDKVAFGFFDRRGRYIECLLSVSKKASSDGAVTGVFCFLQVPSADLREQVLQVQTMTAQTAAQKLKAMAYMRNAISKPLSGMLYCRRMLERSGGLDDEQRRHVAVAASCHCQLNKILTDLDLDSVADSCLDLEMAEFGIGEVLTAAASQVQIIAGEKGVRVVYGDSGEAALARAYGDGIRLQQIIADFLYVSVEFAARGGVVELAAAVGQERLSEKLHLLHLELRIGHSGGGVPEELLAEMFDGGGDRSWNGSSEGLSLLVCRKLVELMNGGVRYLREAGKSTFIITVELAAVPAPAPARPMRTSF